MGQWNGTIATKQGFNPFLGLLLQNLFSCRDKRTPRDSRSNLGTSNEVKFSLSKRDWHFLVYLTSLKENKNTSRSTNSFDLGFQTRFQCAARTSHLMLSLRATGWVVVLLCPRFWPLRSIGCFWICGVLSNAVP